MGAIFLVLRDSLPKLTVDRLSRAGGTGGRGVKAGRRECQIIETAWSGGRLLGLRDPETGLTV